jgi:HEAT repeat protein
MFDDDQLRLELAPGRPLAMRMMALHHLGKDERRTVARVDLLRRLLRDDPNPVIRHDAAFVLGAMSASEAAEALADSALRDESFLVRHESLESLAFFSPIPFILDAVERAERDEHADVRETAAMAGARLRSSHGAASADALLDMRLPIHERWAGAFRLLADHTAGRTPDTARVFERCLRSDPSGFLRHTAAFMLEEVSGADAWDALAHAALEDESPLVRHEAIETLGFLPPRPIASALFARLCADPDTTVAMTARIALDILHARTDARTPGPGEQR